jgi:hypothetical protein
MKHLAIYLLAGTVLASCDSESTSTSSDNAGDKDTTKTEVITNDDSGNSGRKVRVKIDTTLTNTARFIAGMELIAPDSMLEAAMKQDYYVQHKEFTTTTWQATEETMLKPISAWLSEKNMLDTREGTTCFYPLSGPDFLFGNAFYPNAQYYLMMGLEQKGTYPDFTKMDDATRRDYFNVLRGSMKYLNSRGYFVTEHMGSDFTRRHLNGMVHMMVYMMAKTGHLICDSYEVVINDDGSERRLAEGEKAPEGEAVARVVEFTPADRSVLKKAYYFKQDVADDKLAEIPGFEKFIRAFPNRMSYMKSASCVLFNPQFNVMRQLVLSCDKIMQDDTGIPYHYIVEDGSFDIQLFGTYSRVIKQIPWCKQPDLEKDLVEVGENKELPFKISYNGHHNEGIVIYGVRKGNAEKKGKEEKKP